jgi:TonB-linked SusC/RagA family outer membrane protein
VTHSFKNSTLQEVFEIIEKESGYSIIYKDEMVGARQIQFNGDFKNAEVVEILNKVLEKGNLDYRIVDNVIIILETQERNQTMYQQNTTIITGTVTDHTGEPLPGVNVYEKGNPQNGVITGVDGSYTIKIVAADAQLIFSFIGFEDQEVNVAGRNSIDIVLVEEYTDLNEVVIVGYGSQTRSKLTSSISTVKTEDLKQAAVANLENALGGRMSGVFARQVSGEPGYDGADIRIRGFGSALIVVDGVPGRDYSQLDPNEIESISVLKDAASAAVYGMQGANGVILVTTKKGSTETPSIEVNSFWGFQSPTRFPEAMGSNDWQRMQNTFRANNQLKNDPNVIIPEADMEIDPSLPNTNWYDLAVRDYAPMSQTNVSVDGGNDRVKYYFLVGYMNQEGIWSSGATKKDRYNIRSNLDVKLNDNLSFQGGIGGIFTQLNFPGAGQHTIGENIIFTPPIFDSMNDAGYAYVPVKDGYNSLALMDPDASGYTNDKIRQWNVNVSAEYKVPFIEGLSVKGVLGYDTYDQQKKDWSRKIIFYNEVNGQIDEVISSDGFNKTSLGLTDNASYDLTLQGFLRYIKSIQYHNINASLIYEETRGNSHGFNTGRGTYPSDLVDNIGAGMDDDKKWNSEWERTYATQSYIGRLAYDFDTRYLIEFVGRYDGAQYFAPGKRWGFFPAVSAGWMISEEGFMESLKGTISELKLRASWGQLGDMSAARNYYASNEDYYWKEGYKYPGDVLQLGNDKIYTLGERLIPNPDFTWSKSTTYNFGLDGKFLNKKLGFTGEVFYRERTDLPAKKADDNAGNLATYYNLNGDNTRGFEFSIDHQNNISDFRYNVAANFSWARTQYGHTEQSPFTSGYAQWRYGYEGNWNNSQWGYGVNGRYQNEEEIMNGNYLVGYSKGDQFPGDVIYEDWNGDGYIDSKDEHVIGRESYPEMIYGLNIGLEWKGFDCMMFWQGAGMSNYYLWGSSTNPFKMDTPDKGTFDFLGDYWHKSDYTTEGGEWVAGEYPTYRNGYKDINAYGGGSNTFWQRTGSYLRLKNVELGYTLPKFLTDKVNIKSARFYVNAYNLLTFNSFKYIDPETGGGQDISDYPQMKSFNVGLNLKF